MFDNGQLEELWTAISSAFNQDSLRQLLRFKLGKVLDNIVDCHKGFRDLVFDLLTVAEQEGWLPVLFSAIVAARSDNAAIVAFMTAHAPQAMVAPWPGELSARLKSGLEVVVVRKAEPGIQKILDRYHADLRAAYDGITALNRYKKLHDRLHALQVMLPQQLESAADEARKGELTAPLELYAYQVREAAEKAREDAEPLPTRTLENGWAGLLDQVAKLVEDGKPGNPAPLDRAAILLRTVLSEAPRINAKLTDVVSGLRLEGLVEALMGIRDQLRGTPDEADLQAALDGLASLHPRLDGLMQEHFEWQIIDKSFAVAEMMPGTSLAERFPDWADAHTRLANLIGLAPTKLWSVMLQKQIKNLEAAETAHDTTRFERVFDSFRIVARDRFMEVDTQLLEQSGHLATVAPALANLV